MEHRTTRRCSSLYCPHSGYANWVLVFFFAWRDREANNNNGYCFSHYFALRNHYDN
jgi:hypothetical protein